MNYKDGATFAPTPLSDTFFSHLTEEEDQSEEENEEIKNHQKIFLEDKSEFKRALDFLKTTANKYKEDPQDEDLKKELYEVTEFIFDTIKNFDFDIKQMIIDSNFFETICDTIYNCNDINILYQLLVCLGIAIETRPEITEISTFSDICPAVYDAVDRYANILLSPALRIFTLQTNEYDHELWRKIVEFIEWAQNDEYLVLFHEIVIKYSALWYVPNKEKIKIEESTVNIEDLNEEEAQAEMERQGEQMKMRVRESFENNSTDNSTRLKEVLSGINVLLCEKRILEGSLDALINICNILNDESNELLHLWYLILSSQNSKCIEFIFENFTDMPVEFLGKALKIIYLCSLNNDSQPYLFTMLKSRFDALCDFADREDEEISDYSAMIICLLFEGNHLNHIDPIQAVTNIIEYLHENTFRVKIQAVQSISKGLKFYLQYPDLLQAIAESGFVSDVIDLYEVDNIKTKRVVIEAIRRMSAYPSDEIKEGMRDNYGEFLTDIEEYYTDEIIASKLDVIYTFLHLEPAQ